MVGEQLVPEVFITKSISRIIKTGDDDVYGGGKDVSNQVYGYYWWSAGLKYNNKSYFTQSAQGGGGQYIILIEELDLVVVFTDHDNDNTTLQLAAERILPAFYLKFYLNYFIVQRLQTFEIVYFCIENDLDVVNNTS
jgi:hypothetical protein